MDLDFAMPPIGSTVAAIPDGAQRGANCYDADYIDCEYRADTGVYYLVYGHTLTRKRMVIGGRATPGLPFGLRGDESADEALEALNARYGPVFTRYDVEGRVGLTTQTLSNEQGFNYTVAIAVRGDGGLEEISVGGIAE
jgi:hypothetical protein